MSEAYSGMNSRDRLALALQSSFIDETVNSDELMRPKLLSNDYEEKNKVLTMINSELHRCDTFLFSVAFVTKGGITVLKNAFRYLESHGIKGRILTSTYNLFNTPDTFRELLKHRSIVDVRIYDEDRAFHSKGYIFKYGDNSSFIIGSSNLTQNALTRNQEWNIKMNSTDQGALIKDIEKDYERAWRISEPLTEEWIDQYEKVYHDSKIVDLNKAIAAHRDQGIKLNKMQREALARLERLRDEGADKAILISATGTGKTYLSAFDVLSVQPGKFLFVIHRENIARKAMESYGLILGDTKKMGLLTGNNRVDDEVDYVFATIQTLSRDRHLETFPPDYFDYIVIDEVHRAGAETYQKIMDHFKPKFMLGMSATPERMDGFNIVEMFDYNIAYEIRLQEAMAFDLLCPFHYFAIRDFIVDGVEVEDDTDFNKLVEPTRVQHIIENLRYFGHSGNRPRGLIFCSRKDEAISLSRAFNERGFRTRALTGESSEDSRRIAIDMLEQHEADGGLDYLFTVDIFNEGIDIPKVNQVVMLRPTQSSIIFIQQLGRGLRKTEDKQYVVVLDFIGNYENNYMIPMALSGDRTYNKDFLRRFASEANSLIPGSSTVNFDEVTKQKIFESINKVRFAQANIIKKEYHYLKQVVGKVPSLVDFFEHGAIDPALIFQKYKSYVDFLIAVKEEDIDLDISTMGMAILRYVSSELGNGMRPHEGLILELLLEKDEITLADVYDELVLRYGITNDEESVESAVRILRNEFLIPLHRKKYDDCCLVEMEGYFIKRGTDLINALERDDFKRSFMDLLKYIELVYRNDYEDRYEWTNFSLYQKYNRKDVSRLLNWEKNLESVINGYLTKEGKCAVFVDYHKSENISYLLNYDDRFINRNHFNWMSKHGRNKLSKDLEPIVLQKELETEIHLFIHKEDDTESKNFYYMGMIDHIDSIDTTIGDGSEGQIIEPIVNVVYGMRRPVREDIYNYIVN